MKKTKIIVPALAVLLLSTAASVSGTVAWFSMNTSIKVSGMTVTTKVSSSLQIAEINAEANFSNEDLRQVRSGILEPASTIDGHNFYYTTDAKSNGDARADEYVKYDESDIRNGDNPLTPDTTESNFSNALGKTDRTGNNAAASDATKTGKSSYDVEFNDAYGFSYSTDSDPDAEGDDDLGNGDVSFAYMDYSFYLKAYTTASEKIALTRCNMKYDGGSLTTEHAWRVALFAHEVSLNVAEENSETTKPANSALKTILNFAESKNQNQVLGELLDDGASTSGYFTDAELQHAATTNADGETTYYKAVSGESDPKAVSATNAIALVTGRDTTNHKNNKAEIVPTAAGNHVYKVVVRLWLEGEDVTCTSDTFATLNSSWALDLGFKLGSDAGVENISNNAA